MKKGNLYNSNPALNKWEEENHLRNMRKKLENVKSTLPPGARAVSSAKGRDQCIKITRKAQPSANTELDGMFCVHSHILASVFVILLFQRCSLVCLADAYFSAMTRRGLTRVFDDISLR